MELADSWWSMITEYLWESQSESGVGNLRISARPVWGIEKWLQGRS
jgi:hypothetical protein